MKIAVLGGSFNPVHIGHLFLADEARCTFGYDKILFVPAFMPPHKKLAGGACDADRVAMLRKAVASSSFFEADTCEMERGGVSYTYDTLCELQEKYSGALEGRIGFIMGDDLAEGFDTWKMCCRIPKIADIVLARRILCSPRKEPVFPYRHRALGNAVLPVSSSDIRERIAGGRSWRYLVPECVSMYIVSGGLYGYTAD